MTTLSPSESESLTNTGASPAEHHGDHRPEREVRREEAGKGHAIGHQEGGQAKQAEIAVMLGR